MFTRKVYIALAIFLICKNVNCTLDEESIYPRESRMYFYVDDLFLFGWISLKGENKFLEEKEEDSNSDLEDIKCLDICMETSDSIKEELIPTDTDNDMIFWGMEIDETKEHFYCGLNLYIHESHEYFIKIYPLPSKYDDSHRKLVHGTQFTKELLSSLENKLKYYDTTKFNFAASLILLISFVDFEEYLCYLALLIAFTEDFKCSACSRQETGGRYNLLTRESIVSQKYGVPAYNYTLTYWKKQFDNTSFNYDPLKVFDVFVSKKKSQTREFKKGRMYFLLVYRNLHLALYSYLKDSKKYKKEAK